ncbi:MAG: DNA replication/repair protein RecF [Acidobacteria bacterium]|nr:DNA replication/repair protein RecF [Acidobacteriota bacterium]
MRLGSIELTNFRNYETLSLDLAPTTTVVIGDNGTGKTNLVEGIAWLALGASFRGASDEAMVRVGQDKAFIRGEGVRQDRALQVEVELSRVGRNRVLVNRQRLQRVADLGDALQVTVFAPDDLKLVKGGPANRRILIDRALGSLAARNRATQQEVDRVLRQRNTLLKQAHGRRTAEIESTLDVWDQKLSTSGDALIASRVALIKRLAEPLTLAYDTLARGRSDVSMTYRASSHDLPLLAALAAVRDDDIRRGTTTVGPHRDEVALAIGSMPARTHASQGEQRSLALSLRLAIHRLLIETLGATPLLILDDVFSELDDHRARALLSEIPVGQVLMTTASSLPATAEPERVLSVAELVGEGAS